VSGFGMAEEPRQVTVTTSPTGAQITLDDQDVSAALDGYQIEQRSGQPAIVVLFARADNQTVFDGVARVAVAEPAGSPADAIDTFLAAIDPAALDAAVLDRSDLDGGRHELTAALLRQLREWATGQQVDDARP
jgi:hypothetical protein